MLTGYVEGTRDRGKQREAFLVYFSKHKGLKHNEMKRQTIHMWIQLCLMQQSTSKDMTLNDDKGTIHDIFGALWCCPRIASLPLPRCAVRGD